MTTLKFNHLVYLLTIFSLSVFFYVLFDNFDKGLWFDEVFSLRVTDPKNTIGQALRVHSIDASPFTYYFFLRVWRILFGSEFLTAQYFNVFVFVVGGLLAGAVWPREKLQEYLVFLSFNLTSVAIIYYILEIRTYGLICVIAILIAACLKRLVYQVETIGESSPSRILYGTIVAAAGFMIILHAWGAFFGAGILVGLYYYDRYYARRTFGFWAFAISGLIVSMLFFIAFTSILGVYESRLSAASIGFDARVINDPQVLAVGFWQLLYVTNRSTLLGVTVFLAAIYLIVTRYSSLRSSIIVYVTPVFFVFVVVIAAHLLVDRFIYKSYFNVIFFPFIFIFLTNVAFSISIPMVRALVIALVIVANLGSIPFNDQFAKQPYRMEVIDGVTTYMSANDR